MEKFDKRFIMFSFLWFYGSREEKANKTSFKVYICWLTGIVLLEIKQGKASNLASSFYTIYSTVMISCKGFEGSQIKVIAGGFQLQSSCIK